MVGHLLTYVFFFDKSSSRILQLNKTTCVKPFISKKKVPASKLIFFLQLFVTHCGIRLQRSRIPFEFSGFCLTHHLWQSTVYVEVMFPLGLDFSVLNFLSILSDLPLTRENGTQKS